MDKAFVLKKESSSVFKCDEVWVHPHWLRVFTDGTFETHAVLLLYEFQRSHRKSFQAKILTFICNYI